MSEHDVVIRGGLVVDGTGAPARVADVALQGSVVTAVGEVSGAGRRELDAKGMLVTPGFVDMHTHYDGQATWDPHFSPSSGHGVTTVVMGNCGVGFAPCRAEHRDWLINVMEGVEDIPGAALHEGIQWDWESFPEYLDALQRRPHALDYATQVPHSAIRGYVMGPERSEQDDATPEEIAQMASLVGDAIEAGALGFSTSRTPLHKTAQGVLVAGTSASMDELTAIAAVLASKGALFEISCDNDRIHEEVKWLDAMAREQGTSVLFNLTQTDPNPEGWMQALAVLEQASADGIPLTGQVAGRSIGLCMCWRGTAHPFALYPSWQALATRPWEEQLATLRDASFRAKLLAETAVTVGPFESFITQTFGRMFPMVAGFDYEPEPEESLAAIAARSGVDVLELVYDALMERDGEGMIYFPLFNYASGSLDPLHTLHAHPNTRFGLADGGAHCGAICDAGMPTFMLTHWARDRRRGPKLGLEHVVKRQTKDTADIYGLHDRGVLAPGMRADVNVIDFDNLKLGPARMAWDLPAGGRRLLQDATGYRFTIIGGEVVYIDGEHTGVLGGTLLRGPRARPA
ncbi:MAG: N-acyl-D-amino-acid deacylase family protein [Nannocystales bacterium]